MARYHLSQQAELDLVKIDLYSVRTWGLEQADRYLRELEDCCRLLAGRPRLGRACDEIRHGLRRMEQGSHVIFYREESGGILITRILHQRMLPERHDIDEDD